MKIKRIDIIICLLYFSIFKIHTIPTMLQQTTKIIFIFIICLFLIANLKWKRMVNQILPFSLAIILSGIYAYIKRLNGFDNFLDGILYAICLYCLYSLLVYCREIDYVDGFINCFYWMTLFYALASIGSIMLRGRGEGGTIYYWAGNKFSTSYLFIMLAALYWVKFYKEGVKRTFFLTVYIGLTGLAFYVSRILSCSTALVVSIILLIFPFLPLFAKRLLQHAKTAVITILATTMILLGLETILLIPQVQHIVVNMLGESLSLTGRMAIYRNLSRIVSGGQWLGFGYGNTRVISINGYGNAQNGLMQIVVDFGLIGCIVFLWTVYKCFGEETHEKYQGLYALAYAMIAAAIVEVSFNFEFFFAIFAIYAVSHQKDKIPNNRIRFLRRKLVLK